MEETSFGGSQLEPRFHVLGELLIRVDGVAVPPPGRGERTLLGVLLLAAGEGLGEGVPDDRLLELVWGPGRGSRRALQCAVSRLRSWLRERIGSSCRMARTGTGYRLDVPTGSVDLTRFRDQLRAAAGTGDAARHLGYLSAALQEWRGPVLGGGLEWLATEPIVVTLDQARNEAACRLADLALLTGRPGDAVPLLTQAATAAPYDEPVQAGLVRLLEASGRHAEAARQVDKLRCRLTHDLGVAPSGDLGLTRPAWSPFAELTARPPAQLPPDLPDFTGRRTEIQALCDRVSGSGGWGGSRTMTVSAVTGMAGTGKSTLVVHVAHRVAALFPDGQLYADLRGTEARPVDPAEVLGWFLHALRVPGTELPDAPTERAALFRTCTAGRRLLVLLDNAAGAEQVRPLLPGAAGCAVLVSSRDSLVRLAGAHRLELGPFAPDEAVLLFQTVTGRTAAGADPRAAEVAGFCGHLPLAVRIAAARLAARPRLGLDRLIAALRDEDRRLGELAVDGMSVRAALEPSYQRLDGEHRRALRLLGLLSVPHFATWLASAAVRTSPETASAQLETLADARLLEVLGDDPAGQVRYRIPELVRLYARERARTEDSSRTRRTAVRRALRDCLDRAESARRRLSGQPSPDLPPARPAPPGSALAWFDAEADVLPALVGQGLAYGLDDLVVRLTHTVAAYYRLRCRYDDWRDIHGMALRAAEHAGDRSERESLLASLSRFEQCPGT
ncbi:AfsR/SARP family transcriptional regulator [Plantactinospora endophytica]|uniref:OmpR/PhoB-type domain-containing protein n=1 Tax=Plantactinospora endophytica TaxID=673535 RepID=A0ABQ4E9F9_9ACTN|nr:BTAD domain-containing putative transcriptional regulator [Plantactinospora endophytica]GIG91310.1 hypothetical protein Pen02_62460 [Plantactinospora endophytica]